MWRDYLGPDATITGVDIDPRCKSLEAEGFEIWIGDQADPQFWRRFLEKHPQVDVVIDDGGHEMRQQVGIPDRHDDAAGALGQIGAVHVARDEQI